jgi:hypothetical protein
MHLGIARLVSIFGRRRRIDDMASTIVPVATFSRQLVLHVEQPLAQIVRLKQVAEAAHRGLIPAPARAEINPDKRRIASELYSASSTAGSDRLNHCCKK